MDGDMADQNATMPIPRRVGDTVAIGGDYQYRALHNGPSPQRFWHDTKRWLADTYLKVQPGQRVLDVGCGSGVVANSLAEKGAGEVVGVDGNVEAIRFSTQTYQRPNLRFVQSLVDELEFSDHYFDAACCMELIEHIYVPQGQELLRSLARLVRPGGRLLITTPNYRSLWPVLEWALDRSGKVPHLAGDQHVAFYNHRMLKQVAESSGWKTVAQKTCCTIAPWVSGLSWSLAERIRRAEAGLPFGTLLVHVLERKADSNASPNVNIGRAA
jgi:2-polyprenyl-3-methyl-5-hydroxy-6-metoxy-1,4-benzoquinol methylase